MKKMMLSLVALAGMNCMAMTNLQRITLNAISNATTASLPFLFVSICSIIVAGIIVRYLGFFGYCLLSMVPVAAYIFMFFL